MNFLYSRITICDSQQNLLKGCFTKVYKTSFAVFWYNEFMGRIVQLSKNVINQIAAGEVIERPFSVVKELVENSIDAGASKISVEAANECRDLRVADNGSGIHPDDIILAFSKHATSKIQSAEDLFDIHTMGFRGEALPSIGSVSRLSITSRQAESDTGWSISVDGGKISTISPASINIGTRIEVRDIFYATPARLKFLKSFQQKVKDLMLRLNAWDFLKYGSKYLTA